MSFTFNIGEEALTASTLWHMVKAGRFDEAGWHFGCWALAGAGKLPELVRRRATERALWERGL